MPLHDPDEIPWKETRAIRSNRDLMREIRAGLTALRARERIYEETLRLIEREGI